MARAKRIAPWAAVGLLAAAMVAYAVVIMLLGRETAFQGDELFYFGELVVRDGALEQLGGLEYFFAPHNGHFVVLGRAVYRLLFELAGTDYGVFRAVEVVAYLSVVAPFFVLVRRRTNAWMALALSLAILVLGFSYEAMLWPFDLHTAFSLALGLGAFLALERGDRRGDVAACVMLVLATALIEVGLCFAVGAGVLVLLRDRRLSRLWIAAAPIVVYFIWWLWARSFGQSEFHLDNATEIPLNFVRAPASVIGSLLGLNPTGPGSNIFVTGIATAATVLACIAIVALLWRLSRGHVPDTLWAFLAVVLVYWVTITLGERAVDSVRYLLVGAVLVLLVLADSLRGTELPWWKLVPAFVLVAIGLPANHDKLIEGRDSYIPIARASGTEFGVLEAFRGQIDPGYSPQLDTRVLETGGGLYVGLSAGQYYSGRDKFGSLGYPLAKIRGMERPWPELADATLVGGLGIQAFDTEPKPPGECGEITDVSKSGRDFYRPAQAGVTIIGALAGPVQLTLARFGSLPGVKLGGVPKGGAVALELPPTGPKDPWRIGFDAPIYVCPGA